MYYTTLVDGKHIKTDVDEVKFDFYADVAIAGMGTAGSIAAICCAEYGLKVIGIEQNSGMGGLGSYGGVWDYFYGSSGGRFEAINEECLKISQKNFTYCETPKDKKSFRCFNGAARIICLERAAINAGCELWYNTVVTGVYAKDNRIMGISCIGADGPVTLGARIFIDASGDILLCRMLGLPYKSGRDYDGRQMRFSKAIISLKDGLTRGRWTMKGQRENKTALELSRTILECGMASPCLEEYYEENSRTVFEGTILGLRESPRIAAEEEIRFKDVLFGRQTEKPVFYAFAPVDNVNRDAAFDSEMQQLWRMVCNMHNVGLSVGVPLGAMLPKNFENIIVAGKGVGVDSDLAGCVRMRKDMEKCGEASAAAAYVAVKNSTSLKEIPYEELKSLLKADGCLDKENDIGLAHISEGMHREKLLPLTTAEEVKNMLTTRDYGYAIIEIIKNDNDEIRNLLREWMKSENDILARRSAFAAGALGMEEALDTLISIAEAEPVTINGKPAFVSETSGAVYLLRKINTQRARSILKNIEDRYSYAAEYTEDTVSEEYEMAFLLRGLARRGIEYMDNLEANSKTKDSDL